jgi:hypothetical protein
LDHDLGIKILCLWCKSANVILDIISILQSLQEAKEETLIKKLMKDSFEIITICQTPQISNFIKSKMSFIFF